MKIINFSIASSDYNFDVSVSTTTHNTKEEFAKAANRLMYKRQNVTISSYCDLIREGHSLCHCYDDRNNAFGNSVKTQENFLYTSYIAFDIDHSSLPMMEFLTTLAYQPTVAYTTMSDGIRGNRYRLVYCFMDRIVGNEQYVTVFDTMSKICGIELSIDKCTRSTHQPIFGNALPTCRLICTDLVYEVLTNCNQHECHEGAESIITNNKEGGEKKETILICNDTFLKDFKSMPLWKFVQAYCERYKPIEESELRYANGYATIDENYLRIYHRWDVSERKPHKWKDGEGRRNKLTTIALIIRKILPDVSIVHLIYCLAYEVVHYFDDSDGVLDQECLIRIAKYALDKPLDEITIKGHDKRKYKVDLDYWAKRGFSTQAAVGKARGAWNDDRIARLYDSQLTDAENVAKMAENGVTIKIQTLKRWRKKHGYTKYRKRK